MNEVLWGWRLVLLWRKGSVGMYVVFDEGRVLYKGIIGRVGCVRGGVRGCLYNC